jgi:hypothetical protein
MRRLKGCCAFMGLAFLIVQAAFAEHLARIDILSPKPYQDWPAGQQIWDVDLHVHLVTALRGCSL